MDNFDSNFKNDQFEHQSELPEGFGWDDMKEGIYDKMQTTDAGKNNRHWIWLLLFLLIVGSIGSWFTLEYLNEKKSITPPIVHTQEDEKEENIEMKNIGGKDNTSQQNDKDNSADNTLTQSNLKHKKIAVTKKKTIKSLDTNTIQFATNPRKNIFINRSEESKEIKQNELHTPISHDTFVQHQKNKTTDDKSINTVSNSSKTKNKIEKLQPIVLDLIESKSPNLAPLKTPENIKTPTFKKHLSLGLAGGIINWTAFDATNINHDFVSGFPGYTINPSVSLSLTPKHAIQVDYGYSVLEELFDYQGSRAIEVSSNETVRETISSLTGHVIYSEQEDVTLSGTRSYLELKYNQYKLHTLSLGYRFDQITIKKSSFGFYAGTSYLLQLNNKGKRLDEQLDVITFDNSNPLFQNNQLGLRFGIHYNYQLNTNTKLFSQIMTTKYITNWEIDNSNSATRPFLYGLQIGLRYSFRKLQ